MVQLRSGFITIYVCINPLSLNPNLNSTTCTNLCCHSCIMKMGSADGDEPFEFNMSPDSMDIKVISYV